jgi:hypothetical protein
LDGDGDLDALTADAIVDRVSVLFNDGSGVFAAPMLINSGNGAYSIATCDLDRDGDLDVVTADLLPNGTVSVHLNDGNGVLAAPMTFPAGHDPSAVACGDVDADGTDDIVSVHAFGIRVIFNLSAPGDLDCDGDVDLADYGAWSGCLSGPAAVPGVGCTTADFNDDDRVDLRDFAVEQAAFTGAL